MRTGALLLCAVVVAGCEPGPSTSTRDASARDGALREDAAPDFDAGEGDDDAGATPDGGGMLDAGPADAGDAGTDAGVVDIAIDGVLSEGEWAAAASATNATASDWGPTLNRLDALRLYVDETHVWIAIEGAVEEMNGIVVYVDGHDGAGVCDLSTLTDSTGAVDDRLSAGLTTPATFCADAGWSTRFFGRTAAPDDPDLGWRDIDTGDPANFAWVSVAEAPTVCGTGACETRLPRAQIGVVAGDAVRVFARLGNATGTAWSNQTLPEDAPGSPGSVSAFLEQVAP